MIKWDHSPAAGGKQGDDNSRHAVAPYLLILAPVVDWDEAQIEYEALN